MLNLLLTIDPCYPMSSFVSGSYHQNGNATAWQKKRFRNRSLSQLDYGIPSFFSAKTESICRHLGRQGRALSQWQWWRLYYFRGILNVRQIFSSNQNYYIYITTEDISKYWIYNPYLKIPLTYLQNESSVFCLLDFFHRYNWFRRVSFSWSIGMKCILWHTTRN